MKLTKTDLTRLCAASSAPSPGRSPDYAVKADTGAPAPSAPKP